MKKLYKNLITKIVMIVLLVMCVASCNKYEPMDMVAFKNINKTENITKKYIINTRSGKVHTYSHGLNVIKNKDYIKETDDGLESILRDEKYDICHTCYAGLLVNSNVKKYDINLIEKYMRLYDFVQIEPSRAEFLMSVFAVGNWYANNVYTYQGGKDNVPTIELNAKSYASEKAYDRWKSYKASYSECFIIDNSKRILPVVYDGNNKPSNLVLYECDLFSVYSIISNVNNSLKILNNQQNRHMYFYFL